MVGLAAGILALSACGQRGPLYLPTDPAAAHRASLPQSLRPGFPSTDTNTDTDTPARKPDEGSEAPANKE